MELDDGALPLTRGQLDIWLAQKTGHSGTEWQLGLFVRIEGTVEPDALEWAIGQVMREAEPARAAIFGVDGQVFQRAIDYPDLELDFYDLSCSGHPVQEAQEIASSIQRTPLPLAGPLFKFALFRTRLDEFYLFASGHHIVIDVIGVALVGHRIAAVYSAIASFAPIAPAFFGSLQNLVDCELEYEASNDYLEDQAYWTRNLPAESGPDYRLPQAVGEHDYWPSAPVPLDPMVLRPVNELCHVWNVPRTSFITAACALLVHGWCAEGSEVVLDFPVSRRVRPESKTLPGMVAGVVPLVLTVSAETTKTRRERVVPYSASTGVLLSGYLAHRATISRARGPLFLSESRRNHGEPLTLWTWSKVIRRIALAADLPRFSTHTTRHLCLTDLARMGWDLHAIASFAGDRSSESAMTYIHLSGRDLSEKLRLRMQQIHSWRVDLLTGVGHGGTKGK